jgi:hypothetical protein
VVDSHRLEPRGKKIYKRRKETVERSFADAKLLRYFSPEIHWELVAVSGDGSEGVKVVFRQGSGNSQVS